MEYYPKMQVIIMLRNPESVIGSFNRKGWFSNTTLSGPNNYPPYKVFGQFYLSYLVADEDADRFIKMSNIERSAYYYLRAYGGVPDNERVVIVDYDDFVDRPRETLIALTDHFGLEFGDKTEEVLNLVKEPVKDRSFSWSGVEKSLKSEVFKIAEKLRSRAVRI